MARKIKGELSEEAKRRLARLRAHILVEQMSRAQRARDFGQQAAGTGGIPTYGPPTRTPGRPYYLAPTMPDRSTYRGGYSQPGMIGPRRGGNPWRRR